jgi:2,5-diketo-D-gluconate reductase A
MVVVPAVRLNNGVSIPQLGFGVYKVPAQQTQRAVTEALEAGYRLIDTAAAYGNEAGVGAAIATSGIPRDEIFITTKLRNGEQGSASQAFEASREALGVDVIDLYLIHWPVPSQGLFVQAWQVMEKIYESGGARAIGVSNFLSDHLDTLLAQTTVVPAVNQIELHPSLQQAGVTQRSRALGIAVEGYSPLGRGADLKSAIAADLALKHGATPAQIILAWHLSLGNIVVPKSTHPERIRENIAAVGVTLSPQERDAISALDSGTRISADPAIAAFSQM